VEEALQDPRSNKSLIVEDTTGETIRLKANASGELLIEQATDTSVPSAITSGNKNVTTAGTAVKLVAATTACKRIYITGKTTNTGIIYIGGSTVASTDGTFIYTSQTIVLDIDDVFKVWIDSAVNGEGVQFSWVS
jgi:hypothetical protein